jgi:hypothetical protein
MEKFPKIVAAAFKVGNTIHTGPTHGHIYAEIGDAIEGAEEGFVTDEGDFLNRTQALALARVSGQVPSSRTTIRPTELDSGDVAGTKGYRKMAEGKSKKKLTISTKDIPVRNPFVVPMVNRGSRVFKDKRRKPESKYSHKYKKGSDQYESASDRFILDKLKECLLLDEGYHAYVLSPESRAALLKKHPPKYPEVIAHHVTHAFGVKKESRVPEHPKSVEVIGHVDDGKGVQAAVVKVDGREFRPDGKRYHVTISIDRSKGRKPVHSNDVISDLGYTTVRPYRISAQARLVEGASLSKRYKQQNSKRPGISGSAKELATATVADMVARDYVSPEEDKLASEREAMEKATLSYV